MSVFPSEFLAKDGRAVTIRRVSPDDADSSVAYINEICGQTDYLSFGPGEFESTADDQRDLFTQVSQADDQLFLLAVVEGRIAGTIHFGTGARPRTRHAGEFGMAVHQDFWGLGIGRRLLDSVIDWARRSGFVKKINLRVRTDNEPAIRLYESTGFAREGVVTRDYLIEGQFYDSLCMGLEL